MTRNLFPPGFISLADIYLAYRKAKSDAYYDSFHPSVIAFSEFEQNLKNNLYALYAKIVKGDEKWWQDSSFIGDYLYVVDAHDD